MSEFYSKDYNPRIGTQFGRVRKEDFSIDGKSWDYRDPYNQEQINRQNSSRERGRTTINEQAYSKANPLYDYSYGAVRDAAASLGIGNVDKKKEVRQIINRIQKPSFAAAAEQPKKQKKKKKANNQNDAKLAAPIDSVLSKPAAEANAFVEAHNQMTIGNTNPLTSIAASNQAGVNSPDAGQFKAKFQLNLGKDENKPLTFTEGITGTKPTASTGFMSRYKDAIKRNLEPM